MFGIGMQELVIIGIVLGPGLIAAIVVIVVVAASGRGRGDPK